MKYVIAEALAESVSEALGWDKDTIQLEKNLQERVRVC